MHAGLNERHGKDTSSFPLKCAHLSQWCAVLLAFAIPLSTFGTNVILAMLTVSGLLAGEFRKKVHLIRAHPVAQFSIVFFLVFVIGAFYSQAPVQDRMASLGKMSKVLFIPFLLPLMTEQKWRHRAIGAFVSAAVLTLILSLLKFYGYVSIPGHHPSSTVFKDYIFTGLMMAYACFIVEHHMLSHPNIYNRLWLGGLWALMTFYVFFISPGRSGYVAFFVLHLLLFWQRFPLLKGVILGSSTLLLILTIAGLYSEPFRGGVLAAHSDVQGYQKGEAHTSVGLRLHYLKQSWNVSKQRIVFGSGTGSFKETYKNYAALNNIEPTSNPHNEYINIFLQLGIIGLGAFLGLLWAMLRYSVFLPAPERWLAQGIVAAIGVGCFANSWLMDFTSGYFFVALTAGCFGALPVKTIPSPWERLKVLPTWIIQKMQTL